MVDDTEETSGSPSPQKTDGSKPTQTKILKVKNATPRNGSFTESGRTGVLPKKRFRKEYTGIVASKGFAEKWELSVRENVANVSYAADWSTHEQRMRLFAAAFIELTRRTGGTNRDMRFVVRRSGSVWYEWKLTDQRVRKHLLGEITRQELLETVDIPHTPRPTTTQPEPTTTTESQTPPPTETKTETETQTPQTRTQTETKTSTESPSGPGTTPTPPEGYAVVIRYSGYWRSTIFTQHNVWPVTGHGTTMIDIPNDETSIVKADTQKLNGDRKTLTVQILDDGTVVAEASTDDKRGKVTVEYRP